MKELLLQHVQDSIDLKRSFFEREAEHILAQAADMAERLRRGCRILVCGNGGSAADAQHFAAELSGRYVKERRALAGIALSVDTSALTAIGNDYGYERVFSRQIEALGQPGDVFLGISTSGNSPNILCALQQCRTMGIHSMGFTGATGGKMKDLCDAIVMVPSKITQNIQEAHLMLEHILCGLIERFYFGMDMFTENQGTQR